MAGTLGLHLTAGCTVVDAAGDDCVPGDTQSCDCPDQGTGTRTCKDDGSGFGACAGCVAAAGGSSGATGGASAAGGEVAAGGTASGGRSGSGGTGSGGAPGAGGDEGAGGGLGAGGTPMDAGAGGAPGAGGADGGAGVDLCFGISPAGACLASDLVGRCIVPTGDGTPQLITETCGATEQCSDAFGFALCLPLPGTCTPGEQECVTGTDIRVCSDSGAWQLTTCPIACRSSALGAFCDDGVPTSTFTGRVTYELRGPNASFSDWDTSVASGNAVGLLVLSTRGGSTVDATVTDGTGSFSVEIPSPWQPGDQLLAMLVRPNATRTGMAFAVAQPGLADGEQDHLNQRS